MTARRMRVVRSVWCGHMWGRHVWCNGRSVLRPPGPIGDPEYYTIRWLMTVAALFISAYFLFIPLSGSWC
ncbi:hypothetical protein GCM10022233_24210 [Streptomyces shaanxiensis]|uniref:Uncharacterized protein n=1 Tax=Streptomyces shaanxiensis TaxID=653357 RepID=A0ABP7UTK7_9ACTN